MLARLAPRLLVRAALSLPKPSFVGASRRHEGSELLDEEEILEKAERARRLFKLAQKQRRKRTKREESLYEEDGQMIGGDAWYGPQSRTAWADHQWRRHGGVIPILPPGDELEVFWDDPHAWMSNPVNVESLNINNIVGKIGTLDERIGADVGETMKDPKRGYGRFEPPYMARKRHYRIMRRKHILGKAFRRVKQLMHRAIS